MREDPLVATRLIVYGTLRPGQANAHLLEGLGTWEPATLRGAIATWSGYPVFTPSPDGDVINADLLTAPDLVAHLPRLDAFEGPAYRRAVVVAQTADGPVEAQCYVAATHDATAP